jgi:ribosomal-protein-alanine N-acetyltransferase
MGASHTEAVTMITQHEIGLAVISDVFPIAQLSRDAVERGLSWSWTPPRVMRCLRDAESNVVVARQAGRLCGFAIMKYADDDAHLLLLAVHPAQRRQGIGSALLAWLETTVQVAGLGAVMLEARADNRTARDFYASKGYTIVGRHEGYYEGVVDAVRLRKPFRFREAR